VNGLPEGVQSTCNNFMKLMQANEGPWKSSNNNASHVSAVTFQETRAAPHHNLLQNDTEDAVETVRTAGVEAYQSPYICKILTERKACTHISSLDLDSHIFDSFMGPKGTNIALPIDGPPLPDAFVASLHDNTDGSIKTPYFHVDTGATCVVTDQTAELHCPIPTKATCGTAAKGPITMMSSFGFHYRQRTTNSFRVSSSY
jgi:hypothetical protein